MKYLIPILAACLLMLGACGSMPEAPVPGKRDVVAKDNASALSGRSGDATADRSESTPFGAGAASYLGDALTYQSQTKTAREAQLQNTGPMQFVFQAQADMGEMADKVRQAVYEDAGVRLLKSQIEVVFPVWRDLLRRSSEWIGEGANPWAESAAAQAQELERLRAELNAHTAETVRTWTETVTSSAEAARVDLSAATTVNITSWNWNQGTSLGTGHEALTDAEAAALAEASASNERIARSVAGKAANEEAIAAEDAKRKAAEREKAAEETAEKVK